MSLNAFLSLLWDSGFVWCSRPVWRCEGLRGKHGQQSAALLPPLAVRDPGTGTQEALKCLSEAGVGHVCVLSACRTRMATAVQNRDEDWFFFLSYFVFWTDKDIMEVCPFSLSSSSVMLDRDEQQRDTSSSNPPESRQGAKLEHNHTDANTV